MTGLKCFRVTATVISVNNARPVYSFHKFRTMSSTMNCQEILAKTAFGLKSICHGLESLKLTRYGMCSAFCSTALISWRHISIVGKL